MSGITRKAIRPARTSSSAAKFLRAFTIVNSLTGNQQLTLE